MQNLKITEPADRDNWGQYTIDAGIIHVYPFTIPMFGAVKITLAHILPNSQDFSIDSWVSTEPLDGLVLQNGFGHHRLIRRHVEFIIYDQYLRQEDGDHRMFLKSGQTYYLNVKDLQNRTNAYEMHLDELSTPPTP